jgi:hypothetical protein
MEKSTAPALLITKIQKAISLSFLDPVPNSVDDFPTRFRVKDYSCGAFFGDWHTSRLLQVREYYRAARVGSL